MRLTNQTQITLSREDWDRAKVNGGLVVELPKGTSSVRVVVEERPEARAG